MSESKADESGGEHRFIVGGSQQLAKGIRAAIEKQVEAEFSERMAEVGWLGRMKVRRQIRAEIKRRIAKQMPSIETLW
jgi:hypothetical protein